MFLDGGADRNRTCDLLIANETLYQLSYDPIIPGLGGYDSPQRLGTAEDVINLTAITMEQRGRGASAKENTAIRKRNATLNASSALHAAVPYLKMQAMFDAIKADLATAAQKLAHLRRFL